MQNTECIKVKIVQPTKRKAEWLDTMADSFSQAVQYCLDRARELHTSSRGKIHDASYYDIRGLFNLPADYARMAINQAVSLVRSYYRLREKQKSTSFPQVRNSQGIGLGTNAYIIKQDNGRCVLRCSTGERGNYIWLPLCIPERFQDRIDMIDGDAQLLKQDNSWYAILPVKREIPTPTACGGEPQFIGVDLGIVKTATVSTPDGTFYFDGEPARHKRGHFADLRQRYQRANRLDKVRAAKGKESRWMYDRNHKISRRIVEIASEFDNPIIVFERLDGIRYRTRGSKRFNRMISSWAFRDLISKCEYKAERRGIPVIFVDPRSTSRTCPRCGHSDGANRKSQALFHCAQCHFEHNSDVVASVNIAARGATKWADEQEASGKPRSQGQTDPIEGRPDVVKGNARRFSVVKPQP